MSAEGQAYVFGSIVQIVDYIGLAQFIGWVVSSCVRTDVVLDGIISKLQCSVFYVKRAMNMVPAYVITKILGNKWSLHIVRYYLVWLF